MGGMQEVFYCHYGAESSYGIYTQIEMARQNGRVPAHYLPTLFEKVQLASSAEDWKNCFPGTLAPLKLTDMIQTVYIEKQKKSIGRVGICKKHVVITTPFPSNFIVQIDGYL